MILFVIVAGLALVAASLLGGFLPLAYTLTHTRLQLYLSFAAGVILGASFFQMLPEAITLGGVSMLRWTVAGLVVLFLLERFSSFHQHEVAEHQHPADRDHAEHDPGISFASKMSTEATTLNWTAAAIGMAAHSALGGLALGSIVALDLLNDRPPGASTWGIFGATLIHKPADALTIVSLMRRSRVPRVVAHLVNLGFSLILPLSAGLLILGAESLQRIPIEPLIGPSLAFSAGTFLCVALSDLLPEIHFHSHDRLKLSIALLLGLGLMYMASMAENGHHHG